MNMSILGPILKAIPWAKVISKVKKTNMIIEKQTEAEINGVRGFLIWDYLIYNEISFDASDGTVLSFYSGLSDEKTKAEWNRLVERYGLYKEDRIP